MLKRSMLADRDRSAETDTSGGVSRRGFLAGSAAAAAATTFTVGTRHAFATPEQPGDGDVLVVVFLRGGADGLSLVAPFQMQSYRDLRPNIRVKDPGEFTNPAGLAGLPLVSGGNVPAFPLSGTFAMHPAMQPLFDGPWADGNLAITHCAGMPASESGTRSHFDAQSYWERGTANINQHDGFMNRYLAGQTVSGLPAVGRGSQLPEVLGGDVPAFSMRSISSFNVSGFRSNTDAATALDAFYTSGTPDLMLTTGANTLDSIGLVTGTDWDDAGFDIRNGAVYPDNSWGRALREAAMLIRADVGLRVMEISMGGWDTHDDMGIPEDPNSNFRYRAGQLADGLAAFYTDLGSQMDEVTLFTLSDFGRTINENGSMGTDHGRGSCMMAMGTKINGGIHGGFVSTIEDGPEDDLEVITDFRRPVSEILSVRGDATNLSSVFPTYSQETPLGLCQA